MTTQNRSKKQTQDAQMILGIKKNLANVPTITLAGTTMTPTDLVARIQACIDAGNATKLAYANWRDQLAAERVLQSALTPTLKGLRQYVLNTFGAASAPLADFGMQPPKVTTPTPAVQVVAAAKRAATRKARHTMGPVEKRDVKGSVTTTIVTTPTTTVPVVSATSDPTPTPLQGPAPSPVASPTGPVGTAPRPS